MNPPDTTPIGAKTDSLTASLRATLPAASISGSMSASAIPILSPRQKEILDLCAQGLLYKEIAERLCISLSTVKHHIERIKQKNDTRSRQAIINRQVRAMIERSEAEFGFEVPIIFLSPKPCAQK